MTWFLLNSDPQNDCWTVSHIAKIDGIIISSLSQINIENNNNNKKRTIQRADAEKPPN